MNNMFKNQKYKDDLVYLYICYAYLDIGLREEKWVIVNKKGVNELNKKKMKKFNSYTQMQIKNIFNTTKRIFHYLMQEGLFKKDSVKGQIVINLATTEINKAFSGYKNSDVVAIYLAVLMLIKWQEDVKYKTFDMKLNYKFLGEFSLQIEDDNSELEEYIDKSIKASNHFYKNIYSKYNWYEEVGKINLKELFNKGDINGCDNSK